MTTLLPLPRPQGDPATLRVQHGLLRYVREAATARTPLPGEIELTTQLGCTRQQLRNAMSQLEAQGIVRRRQGTVTTVDPIALRMSVRLEELFEHSDLLDRLGYEASSEVLGTSIAPLSESIAAVMELPRETPALSVRKRWRADGAVAMVADDTVPLRTDATDACTPAFEPDESESVFEAVQRVWGEPVIWEVSTPGLTTIDERVAELLERPVGTPVLTFDVVGLGASGRRLMHSFEYHDPTIVSYSVVRTVRAPWRNS